MHVYCHISIIYKRYSLKEKRSHQSLHLALVWFTAVDNVWYRYLLSFFYCPQIWWTNLVLTTFWCHNNSKCRWEFRKFCLDWFSLEVQYLSSQKIAVLSAVWVWCFCCLKMLSQRVFHISYWKKYTIKFIYISYLFD